MAGIDLPADGVLDSFDVHGALLGESGAKGRDHLVQQDNGKGGNYGFRVGKWKLQRHDSGRARNIVVTNKLANTNVAQYRLAKIIDDGRSRF